MTALFDPMLPELLLIAVACALFLLGISRRPAHRRLAAPIALAALLVAMFITVTRMNATAHSDPSLPVQTSGFVQYVKFIGAAIGALLVLLAFPSNAEGTASPAIDYGEETAEFFGLMLLSLAGLFLVAEANDIMLLFLGIELASIPTYIMVSVSRPLPVAQEAGVKYFFLGAMAAALLLFGFSYLYGVTGTTTLFGHAGVIGIDRQFAMLPWTAWKMLAVVLVIAALAFKMAAVPMHVYAADVYQGAATPVTAFLSFVPKTTGFVALLRILYAAGGSSWHVPHQIVELLWVLAVLTMTIGNVLGLLQHNIKRVFAYSSIAHSGYMLVGVTALVGAGATFSLDAVGGQDAALRGVLFYLAIYGLMNVGAFGVLILLPSRTPAPATTAETFEDLAGLGQHHLPLALAMTVACFSLTGLPLTVGFWGKFMLIQPALSAGFYWLAAITMLNAAISAAYYLKIVAALFLRQDPSEALGADGKPVALAAGVQVNNSGAPANPIAAALAPDAARALAEYIPAPRPAHRLVPVAIAVAISAFGVLLLGMILPTTGGLANSASYAGQSMRGAIQFYNVSSANPAAPAAAPDAQTASATVQH